MSVAKRLLSVMGNTEEPMRKRLKIATNMFRIPDVISHREAVLLSWLLNECIADEEIWTLINNLLNSEQFKGLNRTDMNIQEIEGILKSFSVHSDSIFEREEALGVLFLNSVLSLHEIRIFHQYFELRVSEYCGFIYKITRNLNRQELLSRFLSNEKLFPQSIIRNETFQEHFLENNIKSFLSILDNFNGNAELFDLLSAITQKCLFRNNLKGYEALFNKIFEGVDSEEFLTDQKHVLAFIAKNISTSTAKFTYRLFYHSFCKAYCKRQDLMFKFAVVLLEIIGFNLDNSFHLKKISKYKKIDITLSTSVELLLEIINVANQHNLSSEKIYGVVFSDLISGIVKSVIFLTESPSIPCYKLLQSLPDLNPLIIVSLVDEIIVYIILTDHEDTVQDYEISLISIFEVFSRLHRVQNLISKMIPTLKSALNGERFGEIVHEYRGVVDFTRKPIKSQHNLLPVKVLQCFTQCVINLASWQVINLFKTLLFHLEAAIDDLTDRTIGKLETNLYVQLLINLTCQFLSSVRMAEHTVLSTPLAKFANGMEHLRTILEKFGKTLLIKEHDNFLLKSFLNLCFTWGEVNVLVSYYTDGDMAIKTVLRNDVSTCNITYLHSYLSVNEWWSISERITNFGDQCCKTIMQKLFIQKAKAMCLFEDRVSDDMKLSIMRNISTDLEENWTTLIGDKYVTNNLLNLMDNDGVHFISIKIIDEVLHKGNGKFLSDANLLENGRMRNALIYSALKEVNKSLRHLKKKNEQLSSWQPLGCKVLKFVSVDNFISEDSEKISEDLLSVKCFLNFEILKIVDETFNLESCSKVEDAFNIILNIPVIFGSDNTQQILLNYLLALHKDFHAVGLTSLKIKCEKMISGILQTKKMTCSNVIDPEKLTEYMLKYFFNSEVVFGFYLDLALKNLETTLSLEPVISFLTNQLGNAKCIDFSLLILNAIKKVSKKKNCSEIIILTTKYKNTICDKITKLVKKNVDKSLIEAYAAVLKVSLSSENESTDLKACLNDYIELALTECDSAGSRGFLLLFITILHFKSQVKISDDILIRIWNKMDDISSDHAEHYTELLQLLFEHIPVEDFKKVSQKLFEFTESSIKENDLKTLEKHIKMWTSTLRCNLKPSKLAIWQNLMELLLTELVNFIRIIEYDENFFTALNNFIVCMIHTKHLPLTHSMIESSLKLVTELGLKQTSDFSSTFNLALSILNAFLRHRSILAMDRLPAFFQCYRLLLAIICKNNADAGASTSHIQKVTDCAHQLEKLTNSLVQHPRHVARISPFLIASILKHFETVTLYPDVKKHLNNSIYCLLSVCDQNSISFLMRILSSASTEMFKLLYGHFKRYYKFIGKV